MSSRRAAYGSHRPGQTDNRSDGSRTITIHDVPTREGGGDEASGSGSGSGGGQCGSGDNQHNHNGVLRLRGGGNTRRVVWSEETVDNEGMGKKKSKICCIYHKPKAFDESSDESSSCDSASDSDDSDESVASETSTSSHASNDSSGVNASKQLRDKAAGKKKKKSGGGSHKCDDEGHSHGREHKSRKQKRSGGSTTIVETHTSAQSSSKPAPNAYERGFTG